MILEKINSPKDLKLLSLEELNVLSEEIRKALINKLSEHGGHIGPNLGDVEAIVAMHYVFSSPKDKIVFDVSHQSYTHKINMMMFQVIQILMKVNMIFLK